MAEKRRELQDKQGPDRHELIASRTLVRESGVSDKRTVDFRTGFAYDAASLRLNKRSTYGII
jgi:hypothetical protein